MVEHYMVRLKRVQGLAFSEPIPCETAPYQRSEGRESLFDSNIMLLFLNVI